ncbi:MAG TPA: TolC family protein [Longimicrobiales bacterium]|nr:TolC family protein [Longimicrobiales bacterium]
MRTSIATLSLALAFGGSLQGQEARPVTFASAVEIALERNTTLKQSENALAADAVSVRQAKLDFLPDLRLSVSGGQTFGRTFDQNEGAIVDQIARSASSGVSTSVTLFDGMSGLASLRQATRNRDAGRLELDRVRQSVVFTVASNFLALIEQREQRRVQTESLASAEALEAQIAEYVEAGTRTVADLYQQQASVASARYDVVTSEGAVALAEVDLVQTLQLDPVGSYDFEAPPLGDDSVADELEPLATLLERALALRSDLAAREALLSAAEQGVKVSSASRWPTVALTAGYNSAYSSLGASSFAQQLDERRGGSISLGVSIPLYDKGRTSAATEQARLAAENADLAIQDARQAIGTQVARAYQDHRSAGAQLSAAAAGAEAAALALGAAEERYQVGAATLVEVTQARSAQVQAAAKLVSARYAVVFHRLLLRYYVGDLDAADVTLG